MFNPCYGSTKAGSSASIAAEDALQRQLAKKLGLKSKRGTMGGDDGLDDLIGGGLDSSGPSGDEEDDRADDMMCGSQWDPWPSRSISGHRYRATGFVP